MHILDMLWNCTGSQYRSGTDRETYSSSAGETDEEADGTETDHEVTTLSNFEEDVWDSVNDGRVHRVDNSKLKQTYASSTCKCDLLLAISSPGGLCLQS